MPGFDNELERIVTELNRAAPGSGAVLDRPHFEKTVSDKPPAGLEQLLHLAVERGASDLLFVAESPAILRVGGGLLHTSPLPLTADEVNNLLFPLLNPEQRAELNKKKSLDFSFVRSNGIR